MAHALVSATVALLVSPLGLIAVVLIVERRPFELGDQYLSFLYGDVLLAVAVGIGFAARQGVPWPWWLVVLPALIGWAFGWWQAQQEISSGAYTLSESHSPSHLYHQYVVYPMLATLLLRALVLGWGRWVHMAIIVVLLAGWGALNAWDQTHPKAPHSDFTWPRDWRSASTGDEP